MTGEVRYQLQAKYRNTGENERWANLNNPDASLDVIQKDRTYINSKVFETRIQRIMTMVETVGEEEN